VRSPSPPPRWARSLGPSRGPTSSSGSSRCLHTAADRGAELVVYPELGLTTFFPRYDIDGDELDSFYETEMPSIDTKPLFDEAARLSVGFALGYAERTTDGHRYNSMVLVERDGSIVAQLPQGAHPRPRRGRGVAARSSTSSAATSSRAPWASVCTMRSAAASAWRSATTVVGRRPIASWACRASSWW